MVHLLVLKTKLAGLPVADHAQGSLLHPTVFPFTEIVNFTGVIFFFFLTPSAPMITGHACDYML